MQVIKDPTSFLTVFKFGGVNQTIGACGLFGEMVEHQDPVAETVRAHFEARAVSRKRIFADGPMRLRCGRAMSPQVAIGVVRLDAIMIFAVIEDGLEHPAGGIEAGSFRVRGAKTRGRDIQ